MGAARAALRFCPERLPIRLTISLGAGVLLAILATTTTLACPVCGPPVRATVTGPGLSSTASIVDATALEGIAITTLPGFDSRAPLTPGAVPANLGQGYEVVRYYQPIGGQTPAPNPSALAYDHFRYYPATPSRLAVYLYEGPIVHDDQNMPQIPALDALAGKWYAASQSEAAALQALLADARAPHLVTTANPASPISAHAQPQQAPAKWQQTSWLLVAGIIVGFVILTGVLRLLRRQRAHATT